MLAWSGWAEIDRPQGFALPSIRGSTVAPLIRIFEKRAGWRGKRPALSAALHQIAAALCRNRLRCSRLCDFKATVAAKLTLTCTAKKKQLFYAAITC
jgi:hypothetical protein